MPFFIKRSKVFLCLLQVATVVCNLSDLQEYEHYFKVHVYSACSVHIHVCTHIPTLQGTPIAESHLYASEEDSVAGIGLFVGTRELAGLSNTISLH